MVKPVAINPPRLGRPLGYAHGMRAGNLLFVAGQIGADPLPTGRHRVVGPGFLEQFERALQNVLFVVEAAGGTATSILDMTIFVKDMDDYREQRRELGDAWKRTMGRHFPAVALVEVSDLFEEGAVVEIKATATVT